MLYSDICLDGKIDGDHHLGHIMLECFRKRKPDDICQIDAATAERETYDSVLRRTIAMARSLRRDGLRPGDVMALAGRNHLNLRIPYYAGLMEGLPIAGVDPEFKYEETKSALRVLRPKVAFCEYENYEYYSRAIKELGLDTKTVTFYEGDCCMAKFMEIADDNHTEDYRPSYFDTDKVYAWLLSTSGTTGILKFAALKHEAAVFGLQITIQMGFAGYMIENGQKTGMNVSPVQWISALYNATNYPLTNTILLQSSKIAGIESYIDMINEYKPSTIISSPSLFSRILKLEKECDLTCLETVGIGGEKVYTETILQLKARVGNKAKVCQGFGSSETNVFILGNANTPAASVGVVCGVNQVKLVDVSTGAEVTEPHQHGELWVTGPACFTEYYNNPEETAKAFTPDGWFKTGDILYRDEEDNFYFVDRLKMLIKYRVTHVIPPELEEVIYKHPAVLEVCVTGVPHPEDGERPAACVVRRPGCDVTAQEIQDLVAENLSDAKQLRGGVVFVKSLPRTSTGKVIRPQVKSLVKNLMTE